VFLLGMHGFGYTFSTYLAGEIK